MKTLIKFHFQSVRQLHKPKMASEGRKLDEKNVFSNDLRMSEAWGGCFECQKALRNRLILLDSTRDNLKKIEKKKKNDFFQFFEAVSLKQPVNF